MCYDDYSSGGFMKKISIIALFICLFIPNIVINAYTEYKIGDEVEYNEIKFYVIKDSSTLDDSVTVLKKEPLTVEEVDLYGIGHVNMFVSPTSAWYKKSYNRNGYGGIQYYGSGNCNCINSCIISQCKTDYQLSEIKYIVDAWAKEKLPNGLYDARILSFEDLTDGLGYEKKSDGTIKPSSAGETPIWISDNKIWLWTMSSYNNSDYVVWIISETGQMNGYGYVYYGESYGYGGVRPVITLSKTALGDIDENNEDTNQDIVPEDKDINSIIPSNNEDIKNELKTSVKVDNTYMKTSIIIILLGFISAVISVLIYYKFSNKKK